MTFDEYQNLARRTQNKMLSTHNLKNHALFGLCSEVGEVHSLFQHDFQGEEVLRNDLVKEIGDVLWFIAELCDAEDMSMDEIATENIEKLYKRYPAGFDDEKSIHRHD